MTPTKTTTVVTQQNYKSFNSEFGLVDLGDGYAARIVSDIDIYAPDFYTYDTPSGVNALNRYIIMTINLTNGNIVGSIYSLVIPIIVNGKALTITKADLNSVSISITRYEYQGLGVWTSSQSVPLADTGDLGCRDTYVKFQHVTDTKYVLHNLSLLSAEGDVHVIENINDLSSVTSILNPFTIPFVNNPDFNEHTKSGLLNLTNKSNGLQEYRKTFYRASDYVAVPGITYFVVRTPRGDGSVYVAGKHYNMTIALNQRNIFNGRDNIDVHVLSFDYDSVTGVGSNQASTVYNTSSPDTGVFPATVNPINYIETVPQFGRVGYDFGNFTQKDNILYAGVYYLTSGNIVNIGILKVDVINAGGSGMTIYSTNVTSPAPYGFTGYYAAQIFVDASDGVYARFTSNRNDTRSILTRLKNGVFEVFDGIVVGMLLPVGNDKMYSFLQDAPN